jgi:hypothetical protein
MQVQQPTSGGYGGDSNGSPVIVNHCHTTPSYRSWTVVNGGSNTGTGPTGPIEVLDGYCLDVTDGVDASKLDLFPFTCYLAHI